MDDLSIVNTQVAQPVDINVDEVLREFGLEHIEQTSTVIMNSDNTIVIPTSINEPSISNIDVTDTVIDSIISSSDENEDLDLDVIASNATSSESSGLEPPTDFLTDVTTAEANTQQLENPSVETESNEQTGSDTSEDILSTEEAIALLPVNSKSVEFDDSTSRFSGATWYKAIQDSNVMLAGLGGIGSWVFMMLSRMKPKQIVLYDDDVVEMANLSGQLYSTSMVGKNKVDAMASLAQDFSMYYSTVAIPQKFTATTKPSDIMICGFDNMEARRIYFNAWVNHLVNHPNKENCLFVDGRLSIEEFQVFCIQGDDTFNINRYYDEYLFKDYQAQSEVCSMKQTTYCSNMIGSVIVNLFTNFIANTLNPVIKRDLPFKTYYDASMMYFKTEL
jgi:molybdopterin/thiamine biosynthesis adenylyltransferase